MATTMLEVLSPALLEKLILAAESHENTMNERWPQMRHELGDERGVITLRRDEADKIAAFGDTEGWKQKHEIVSGLTREGRIELASLLKYGQFEEADWAKAKQMALRGTLVDDVELLTNFGHMSKRLKNALERLSTEA